MTKLKSYLITHTPAGCFAISEMKIVSAFDADSHETAIREMQRVAKELGEKYGPGHLEVMTAPKNNRTYV